MSISARTAYALLVTLARVQRSALLHEVDLLGGDDDILLLLQRRLERAAERGYELERHYVLFLSWLVARVGPQLGISCEVFEDELAQAGATETIVTPKWALAEIIQGHRRMPSRPLLDVVDEHKDVMRAYSGLLDHLLHVDTLSTEHQTIEMLNSAIPWRILAIVDGLEPETERGKPSIATRVGILESKTIGGATYPLEKSWWRLLNYDLCQRRHALSHMVSDTGLSFSHCVDGPWTIADAWQASGGIGLAVMAAISRSLRSAPASPKVLRAVIDCTQTDWLDRE